MCEIYKYVSTKYLWVDKHIPLGQWWESQLLSSSKLSVKNSCVWKCLRALFTYNRWSYNPKLLTHLLCERRHIIRYLQAWGRLRDDWRNWVMCVTESVGWKDGWRGYVRKRHLLPKWSPADPWHIGALAQCSWTHQFLRETGNLSLHIQICILKYICALGQVQGTVAEYILQSVYINSVEKKRCPFSEIGDQERHNWN